MRLVLYQRRQKRQSLRKRLQPPHPATAQADLAYQILCQAMATIRMVQTRSHGSRVVETTQTIPMRLGSRVEVQILARCHARHVTSSPGHLNQ